MPAQPAQPAFPAFPALSLILEYAALRTKSGTCVWERLDLKRSQGRHSRLEAERKSLAWGFAGLGDSCCSLQTDKHTLAQSTWQCSRSWFGWHTQAYQNHHISKTERFTDTRRLCFYLLTIHRLFPQLPQPLERLQAAAIGYSAIWKEPLKLFTDTHLVELRHVYRHCSLIYTWGFKTQLSLPFALREPSQLPRLVPGSS